MELQDANSPKNMMMALSGLTMVLVGASLMMSHPTIRRYASRVRVGNLIAAVLPGIERFMRVKSTQ